MAKFIGFVLLLVIVVGFAVPSLFIDKAYAMDRTMTMDASVQQVHGVISDLRTWDDWTVWNKEKDPTLERTYVGTAGEVGHGMTWAGDELGEGSLELTEVTPNAIRYSMTYEGMPSVGEFLIESRDSGETAVLWSSSGEMGGMPYNRYLTLVVEKIQGPDLEAGLSGLKARVEAP